MVAGVITLWVTERLISREFQFEAPEMTGYFARVSTLGTTEKLFF